MVKTQKQTFENVIKQRMPWRCCNCTNSIMKKTGRCWRAWCFAHILPKGMYPEFKFEERNIALVCSIDCHHAVDKKVTGKKRQIKEMLENGSTNNEILGFLGLRNKYNNN